MRFTNHQVATLNSIPRKRLYSAKFLLWTLHCVNLVTFGLSFNSEGSK